MTSSSHESTFSAWLRPADYLGIALWAVGTIRTIANYEIRMRFKSLKSAWAR